VILIDAGYLTARSRYIFRDLRTSHGTPMGAIYGFLCAIDQIRRACPNEPIKVCFDSYSQWRVGLLSQYKATRESRQEGWFGSDKQLQHAFEKDSIKKLLPHIDGVTVVEAEGAEADDLIGIFAKAYPGSIIFSADKDMWQLTQYGAKITSKIQKGKFVFTECPPEFTQIPPQNLALYRAIMGDNSDGIPKIPKVFAKEVQQMAMQCSTPEELLTCNKFNDTKSFKQIEEYREQLLVNYEVCKLPPNRNYTIVEPPKVSLADARETLDLLDLNSMKRLIKY